MRPRFDIAAATALACGLAAIRVTATPGIESAAVLGVLLPPVIAATTARRVAIERKARTWDRDASLRTSVVRAFLVAFVVVAIAAIRVAFEPACADAQDFAWLAAGPVPGFVLAALVGEAVGRFVPRPRLAAFLAVLVPIAALGVVAWEVVTTPAVYVFTIFGGHWPGPIYDEGRGFPETLVTYRAVTLLAIAALGLGLAFGGPRPAAHRFAGRMLAALLGVAFGVATVRGADLGHRTSVARIDAALGGRVEGSRCVVHLPSETPYRVRRRTLAECEAHVRSVERVLGVRRNDVLHAFVYRDAAEKAALVGAGETYVAKPWRGEIHVQAESFPHAVMRHEIVHVVAAELGPRPFRVSGKLGGLWMNPGLVEGLAVAVAWEPRDGHSPDEWSRAMLELGQLPPVRALMGAGFLGQGASASYSAAGSFVAFVLRTRGPAALGRMYRRGTIGDSLESMERAWHASLREVPLGPELLALARVRLLDRGLLSTRCGRLRARLTEAIADANAHFDYARAGRHCRALLAIDRRDAYARASDVALAARAGRLHEAERKLAAMTDHDVPAPLRARLHTLIGDALVRRGSDPRAHYEAASRVPDSDDALRSLEVRRLALDRSPEERSAMFDAILERGRERVSEASLGARLARLEASTSDGLVDYLLARRAYNDDDLHAARRTLDRVFARGLPTERLRREARSLHFRVEVALALEGDAAAAAWTRAWQEAVERDPLPPGLSPALVEAAASAR